MLDVAHAKEMSQSMLRSKEKIAGLLLLSIYHSIIVLNLLLMKINLNDGLALVYT